MEVRFRLDAPAMIAGVSATTPEATDVPASWAIKVDGVAVQTGSGPIVAQFAPVQGQEVRIECLSADPFYWWSITDLTIEATEIPPVVEPPLVEPPVIPPVVLPVEEPLPDPSSEEWARGMVEFFARKFGWPTFQREVWDFEARKAYVEQAIVYRTARVRDDGSRDFWPFPE
jgi:hypothetical protein